MRDLTLIVTDGQVPPDLPGHALTGIERLPTAELVRGRGIRLAQTPDWWQAALLAIGTDSADAAARDLAVAGIAWYGLTGGKSSTMWFATPVHLTVAIDHVRLDGIAGPAMDKANALAAAFNHEFRGDKVVLHVCAGGHWFLEMPRELSAASVDPGRIVGRDVANSLPSGADAPLLRRLMTEIQMWLHARAEGEPGCNALWLWGGAGRWPDLVGRKGPVAASDEPLMRGLWRLAQLRCGDPVDNFAAARSLDERALLVTVSLERWRTAGERRPLQRLERDWLAPAWQALAAGSIDALSLDLNGSLSRAARRHCWRIWRTRRHWAES